MFDFIQNRRWYEEAVIICQIALEFNDVIG